MEFLIDEFDMDGCDLPQVPTHKIVTFPETPTGKILFLPEAPTCKIVVKGHESINKNIRSILATLEEDKQEREFQVRLRIIRNQSEKK